MKRLIIIGFIFASCTTFGHDKKVDSVLNKWVQYFNKQNYQKAYDLYAPIYKQKVTLDWLTKRMKETFGMMGTLKSIKFVSYKNSVYKYTVYAKHDQIEGDVSLVITKDYQLAYMDFDSIGGTGDPPKAENK